MENDEKHIVNLLKRGSSDGFRKTAVIYGPPIFALALEITGCREEAEEITSDTLMKVFRSIQSYREEKGSFKSWILSIARNSAISAIRRKKPEFLRENIPEIPTETEEESEEDLELLKQAIAKCPVKDRELIHMYYYDRLSLSEISEITGTVSTTLAVRLQRIRQKLKQHILSHHGR